MHGNIEEDANSDYIIAGIPVSKVNKVILYGAVLLSKFKIKLELYAKIKSHMKTETKTASKFIIFKTLIIDKRSGCLTCKVVI